MKDETSQEDGATRQLAGLQVSFRVRAVTTIMAAIPNWLPGKMRLARGMLSALSDDGMSVVRRNGLSYCLPSLEEPIAISIVANGVYEPETIGLVLDSLPPDGLFVDIGANVGAISLPVARARPKVRVLAVEASSRVFECLASNVRANGLVNVLPVCAFAGDRDDVDVPFYIPPDRKFGMGSIGPQFHNDPVKVRQRTLDALLAEWKLPSPDVVKIDIEGAEIKALRGMNSVISDRRKALTIVFEFNNWAESRVPGQSAGDSQRFLIDSGFTLHEANSADRAIACPQVSRDCMVVARRTS